MAVVALVWALAVVPASCGGSGADPGDSSTLTTSVLATTTAPSITTTAASPAAFQLVVDTDLAVDSIVALLYLLGRDDVEVAAITVSGTGEVHCGRGAEIAAGLLTLAGVAHIPVACGPSVPLAGSNSFPSAWRASADEAWGLALPEGGPPSPLSAPELLVTILSSAPDPVVVFTDGPLTNLAAALRLAPRIADRISGLVAMGGAIDVPGNTPANSEAEFNFWVDPTAAAEVLASGIPITLVPLDATNQVPLEARHVQALEEHRAAPAVEAVVELLEPVADGGFYLWDPLAAAILLDESLAGFEVMTLAVTTQGDPDTIGVTRRVPDGDEVRVAVTVDTTRFERELLSSLAGEDVVPSEKPQKRPAATVESLLAALFAAAEAADPDAWAELGVDEAVQSTYLVNEGAGRLVESGTTGEWSPEIDPMQGIPETLGEPLVVGDTAAVAIRLSLVEEPTEDVEGFFVLVGDRGADGLLSAGSASFLGLNEPSADGAAAQQVMEAYVAAWNSEDVDGVLASMASDGVLWGNILYPEAMSSGPVLREMLVEALWLRLAMTGPPVTSGPFAAVPLRFTDDTSETSRHVIAVLWIRDDGIALMAIADGELQG